MSTHAAGAMPGPRASLEQRYPVGPGWAAYRLPFVGTGGLSPREVGIGLDGEPDAGATPPAGGASDPAKPPTPPPATGDDADLGEAGKRALKSEREARSAAERERDEAKRELDELKAASQTDTEKALNDARKAAQAEERARWEARIRRAEVRSALRQAGITNDKMLDLAASSSEFANLKVLEDGSVEKLSTTVDAFKADTPELFAGAKPAPPAQPARGASSNGAGGGTPKTLGDAIADRYSGKAANA